MSKDFLSAIKNRRSYYALSNESPVPDDHIQEIIEQAVKYTPSAFNSQSARVLLLLGENHQKLWNITKDVLKAVVPDDSFGKTEQKINESFKSGYGTILFFEDKHTVRELQEKFELYAEKFPLWSEQSSGMLQFVIWTALELEGFGASLQHYNPLIDERVKKEWAVPEEWELVAQMPFGKPVSQPGEKEFKPIEERVKIFK
ncbi:nitroreductase family protein [Peribacillus kribbensis]|uniref:nitroreductase family protein n=1 Tax=Peribacillus kribbensis TaxID=356658 RepID=UPI00040B7F87|nr:nitroreductase family protein [Peribacillus kribbensis]